MDHLIEGFEGEKIIREMLARKKYTFFQADIIAKVMDAWRLIEVKRQDMFTAPPFDGHGLPKWQIETRLAFQKDTNIRAMLFVVDKATNKIYWQFMDELMKGEHFQTNGKHPRVIFPLTSYKPLPSPGDAGAT